MISDKKIYLVYYILYYQFPKLLQWHYSGYSQRYGKTSKGEVHPEHMKQTSKIYKMLQKPFFISEMQTYSLALNQDYAVLKLEINWSLLYSIII